MARILPTWTRNSRFARPQLTPLRLRPPADAGGALCGRQVLAECERGLGFGIPHSHLGHLNSMEDVVNYFHWRADEAERERAAAATHWTLNLPDNVKLHANVPRKEPPALARGGKDAAASQNPADDE